MITFKEFLTEESIGFPMYRMVNDTVADAIGLKSFDPQIFKVIK